MLFQGLDINNNLVEDYNTGTYYLHINYRDSLYRALPQWMQLCEEISINVDAIEPDRQCVESVCAFISLNRHILTTDMTVRLLDGMVAALTDDCDDITDKMDRTDLLKNMGRITILVNDSIIGIECIVEPRCYGLREMWNL